MPSLLLALAVVVGISLGTLSPGGHGPVAGFIAALVLASAMLVRLIGRGLAPRVHALMALVAVLAASFAYGVVSAKTSGEEEIVGDGVVGLRVVGASSPGPWCALVVEPEGVEVGEIRWRLDADPSLCPRAAGDLLLAPASALRLALAAPEMPWAGEHDPRSGASAALRELAVVPAGLGEGGYLRWVAELREWGWAATRGWPEGGLVVASVLGMPKALPPGEREALREAGLGHLLAVSGLHVALAGAFAQAWLGRLAAALGWNSGWIAALGLLPVALYVALTGGAPSAIRAGIMLAIAGLGRALGRPNHGPTVLASTAALILLVWPRWAADPGLHLSLAAMIALVHPDAPRGVLAQSWRVTWTTLPVALWHFESAAILGVVTNLVALPVFTLWVLPLGMVGALASPWLGPAGLEPAAWGGAILLDVAALAERAPPISPGVVAGLALVLVGCGLIPRLRGRWSPPWLACALVVVVGWPGRGDWQGLGGDWVAVGSSRAPTLIVAGSARGGGGVCVREPGISSGWLVAVLEELGAPDVLEIEAGTVSGGQIQRLRRSLARRGRMGGPAERCQWPARRDAPKSAIKACLAAFGGDVGVARGGSGGDPEAVECWGKGGWRRLASGAR
jgi:ComEC/Rec2-related protein